MLVGDLSGDSHLVHLIRCLKCDTTASNKALVMLVVLRMRPSEEEKVVRIKCDVRENGTLKVIVMRVLGLDWFGVVLGPAFDDLTSLKLMATLRRVSDGEIVGV